MTKIIPLNQNKTNYTRLALKDIEAYGGLDVFLTDLNDLKKVIEKDRYIQINNFVSYYKILCPKEMCVISDMATYEYLINDFYQLLKPIDKPVAKLLIKILDRQYLAIEHPFKNFYAFS